MENKVKFLRQLTSRKKDGALFLCYCGTEFKALEINVAKGKTSSCGCYRVQQAKLKMAKNKEKFSSGNVKHGMYEKYTYQSYNMMMQRCFNEKRSNFKFYGGRGISVCRRWRDSFLSFVADMGHRPYGLTLDRINNDMDYSPENCRWVDMKVQSNNRRKRGKNSTSE